MKHTVPVHVFNFRVEAEEIRYREYRRLAAAKKPSAMEKQQKILSVDVYYMHIPTQTPLDILGTHVNFVSARHAASFP